MESEDFCAWSCFPLDVSLVCSCGLPSSTEQEVPLPVEVDAIQLYQLRPSPSVPCRLFSGLYVLLNSMSCPVFVICSVTAGRDVGTL